MSMSYNAIAIYSMAGDFIGYGIKDDALFKLQSANLWGEHEVDKLNENLKRLNVDIDLRRTWPNPKDPEVLQIVNDKDFMPIEYKEAQVVDDEKSNYVWEIVPAVDENGDYLYNPDGSHVLTQGENLDEAASTIFYKMAMVPANPTDEMLRIKAACEVIARKRAGLD
jgi:hypothetical protein